MNKKGEWAIPHFGLLLRLWNGPISVTYGTALLKIPDLTNHSLMGQAIKYYNPPIQTADMTYLHGVVKDIQNTILFENLKNKTQWKFCNYLIWLLSGNIYDVMSAEFFLWQNVTIIWPIC